MQHQGVPIRGEARVGYCLEKGFGLDGHRLGPIRPRSLGQSDGGSALGCFYWGQVWTLGAWCEDKKAFRSFRIDRIQQLTVQQDASPFAHENGKTITDYVRANAPEGTWQRLNDLG